MPRLPRWFVALAFIVSFPTLALAEPVAQFEPEQGVMMVFHSDKCSLDKQVENLPYRVTWTEKGKTFEGCYGVDGGRSLVRVFFADKTVVALYVHELVKVAGT